MPSSIVSDRDTKFTSAFRKSLCDLMENKMRDAHSIRMKQVLQTTVFAKVKEASEAALPNWLRLMDVVETVINNATFADTDIIPFYLNLGYHPQFFFDIMNRQSPSRNG